MTPYITERNSIGIWQHIQLCHAPPPCDNWRLLSVRTVINMLHVLNQLIVFTIWKLAFSKLTKITPLTCSPFYQYNVWEMVLYEAWRDEWTEACHILKLRIYHFWPNYFSKLSSVWLRRGCLFAWRTDRHNSGVFRRWMEICEWKHEYKVHRLQLLE
jgi:hypothetical protein